MDEPAHERLARALPRRPRLGWARILSIAMSASVVGFALAVAVGAGMRAASGNDPQASSVGAPGWTEVGMALALLVPPAWVAALLWAGGRKWAVWAAAAAYLALAAMLPAGRPWHLAVGAVPTLVAALLYSLPRRAPKGTVLAEGTPAGA